jgi:hypothetical protein
MLWTHEEHISEFRIGSGNFLDVVSELAVVLWSDRSKYFRRNAATLLGLDIEPRRSA